MKTAARFSMILGFACATLAPSLASAHVRLMYPTPRYAPMGSDDMNIKTGPCGRANDSRTTDMSRITVLEPGATIMVQFSESIGHPGFYRISFDDDGQDAFVAPTSRAMVDTMAPFTLPVLVDNIPDIGNTGTNMYTQMVTLPNVECERCTLQLIQVMVNANAMTWSAAPDADIYFTCADIALRRTGGMGGAGGMAGAGGGSPGGAGAGNPGGAGATAGGGQGGAAGTQATGGFSGAATGGIGGMATGGAGGTAGATTGGVATGGVAPTGGTGGGASGAPPQGGMAPGGAPASGAPGAGAGTVPDAGEEPGCGCRTVPSRHGRHASSAAALALLGLTLRRRRGSRSSAA